MLDHIAEANEIEAAALQEAIRQRAAAQIHLKLVTSNFDQHRVNIDPCRLPAKIGRRPDRGAGTATDIEEAASPNRTVSQARYSFELMAHLRLIVLQHLDRQITLKSRVLEVEGQA